MTRPTRPPSRLERDERWARVGVGLPRRAGGRRADRLLRECGAVEALVRLRAGQLPAREGWEVRLPELDLDDMARAAAPPRGARPRARVTPSGPRASTGSSSPPYCLFVRGRRRPRGPGRAQCRGRRLTRRDRLRPPGGRRPRRRPGRAGLHGGQRGGLRGRRRRAPCCARRRRPHRRRPGLRGRPRLPDGTPRAARRVAAPGAVVSEVPVGCAPYRSRFLASNRIIAPLARATVVVEANLRSGSLTTAKAAREHHLPVGAVPGPVTSMTSAGCHALVRDTGAVLVTDAAEVAEIAARIGDDLLPALGPGPVPRSPGDDLDPVATGSGRPCRCTAVRRPSGSPRRLGVETRGSSASSPPWRPKGWCAERRADGARCRAPRRTLGLTPSVGRCAWGPWGDTLGW